ncbi:MAG: FecR domain-containing protein [Chitinophagaceae bacterium]
MSHYPSHKDILQSDEAQRITGLITGYVSQSLTVQEQDELEEWVAASERNRLLFEELTDKIKVQHTLDWLDKSDAPDRLKKLKKQLRFTDSKTRLRGRKTWPYTIAASLLIIAGLSVYMLFSRHAGKTNPGIAAVPQDVAPGGGKATLILADGSRILLENAGEGMLATQGGSQVIKQNGQLLYTLRDSGQAEALFNMVTIPRGGSYPLTLSDGTRLLLNAGSSIRFPAVFTGQERRVTISGEVYFEVAKNPGMPFRVDVEGKDMQVEVVGTHFNINSYDDEMQTQTTLLEGSVKVSTGNQMLLLKPGQQAQLDKAGSLRKVNHVDTGAVVAWKQGLFQFENAGIHTIMRQLSRWYDIDVSYEGPVPDILTTGKAPRNISLNNLLKILSLTGIRYHIQGKKLTILP